MIWNTSKTVSITPQPCHSHLSCRLMPIWPKLDFWAENGAYGLCQLGWRYNGAKVYFYWPYIIESMIWNTYENVSITLLPCHSHFVVDWCQFGPSWSFGLKMELLAYAGLVGGTTEQIYIFLTLYECINYMKYFWNVSITPQPCHSHFCCWLLLIWP